MKTWVFDLDGTLVDSLPIHFKTLDVIFSRYNQKLTRETQAEVLRVTAKTLPAYFEKKFGAREVKPALELFRQLSIEYFHGIKAFHGVDEILNTLKSKNTQIAVWTARDLEATQFILRQTGLDSFISFCVSGSCVESCKPHPEGLQRISRHFNSSSENFVMVGDHENDMKGAKSFGAKAIRAQWDAVMTDYECSISDWKFRDLKTFKNWLLVNL